MQGIDFLQQPHEDFARDMSGIPQPPNPPLRRRLYCGYCCCCLLRTVTADASLSSVSCHLLMSPHSRITMVSITAATPFAMSFRLASRATLSSTRCTGAVVSVCWRVSFSFRSQTLEGKHSDTCIHACMHGCVCMHAWMYVYGRTCMYFQRLSGRCCALSSVPRTCSQDMGPADLEAEKCLPGYADMPRSGRAVFFCFALGRFRVPALSVQVS